MAQDFAKKNATNQKPTSETPRWTWFVAGFLLGLFSAFLVYLWQEVNPDPKSNTSIPTADVIKDKDQGSIGDAEFDFFEMFPNVVVPIVEEYAANGKKKISHENYVYALQAGSFKNRDDANRLRGELILMGLQVDIKKINNNSADWYRVIVGPFTTKLKLTRTKTRLDSANIQTIQLRIKR